MSKSIRNLSLLVLCIISTLLAFVACDGDLTKSGTTNSFHLQGVVVADQNITNGIIATKLWRDDSLYSEMLVLAEDQVVKYTNPTPWSDSAYYRVDTGSAWLFGGNLSLSIVDSNINHKTSTIVPDTFSILTLSPSSHRIGGLSDLVKLSWSGSTNTESYVLAAVKSSAAYTGTGYTSTVTTLNSSGTIPPDAFQLDGSLIPDTGLFNIYVYAITGTPDSALASAILPTPLPVQLKANINQVRFSGWIGSVRVVYRDTVRVITNP